jgi:DNA modification methylase
MGKNRTKARKLQVALSTSLFYEKSQEQKKPEFLEKYKKRSAQEWKNGEMKRFHGLSRARGWGLRSILFQAKLTAIAVNLKRIATITGKKTRPVIAFLHDFWGLISKFTLKDDFVRFSFY